MHHPQVCCKLQPAVQRMSLQKPHPFLGISAIRLVAILLSWHAARHPAWSLSVSLLVLG